MTTRFQRLAILLIVSVVFIPILYLVHGVPVPPISFSLKMAAFLGFVLECPKPEFYGWKGSWYGYYQGMKI